jgi:transcriptional regulator with XRE-family HTH domain
MNERSASRVDTFIGRRIRDLRLDAGLSQTSIAKALGISFQQIQKYENGTNRISASRLYKLANHLDVSLTEFFPS